jgi:hypothetical protein
MHEAQRERCAINDQAELSCANLNAKQTNGAMEVLQSRPD